MEPDPSLPHPPVRAVFFDAVGTLIYPDPPAPMVYAEVGRRFGSVLSPETIRERFWTAFQHEEMIDRAQNLRTSEAREFDRWRNIVQTVLDDVTDREKCFAELFTHFARPESWRWEAEAEGVLRELAARGYPLGMASNYDGRLRLVVAGMPALAPLQHLVISSEVGWRKPAAPFFEAMARAVAVPSANILFVGDDRANDYDGVRAAGMRGILFDPRKRAQAARIHRLSDLLTRFPTLD
jgi:putative hydrolase of the HAD superfamily